MSKLRDTLEVYASRMQAWPVWVRVTIAVWIFASLPFGMMPELRASVPPFVALVMALPYVLIALSAAGYVLFRWGSFIVKAAWWPIHKLRNRVKS